jgi:serine protease inhibitor
LFAKDLQTYDGITLQYVGIMPQREALKDFVENTNAKKISGYISNLKELKLQNFKDGVVTKVIGDIPIFQFDYSLNLKKDLIDLGIKDVFDQNKADLSAMLKDSKDQFIFKAGHKATIDFSNLGIKAAAVTMLGGMGGTAEAFDYLFDVPVETIDVTFDKPYMFLIRDKQSGEVWFTGTVYNPTKKQA